MLTALVQFALRFRGVVIALAIAFLVFGIHSLTEARYDVFPEFAPPVVTIQTEAPGLAPEQVELLVTQPIENEIAGVAGVESLRSGTIQGLSVVTVLFEAGADIFHSRQSVAERLATLAGRLPQGVASPVMNPLTSSTSTVLMIGLTSQKQSLMELRTIADWTIRPRLLAVPGVANVPVFGGETRQLQIQFLPERLVRFNTGIDDVLEAARRATGIRGAGFLDTPNQRLVLQSSGQSLNADGLSRTVVAHHDGGTIVLADVARVADGAAPAFGAASVMGEPGVSLVVSAHYGVNTLEVTRRVEQALEELRPSLRDQGVAMRADLFRPANFVTTAVGNIRTSLMIGAVLVVVVLFLFLLDLRTAAISCTAIPLSLLAAVTLLDRFGYTLNTMTLGGLAIAIGEVVDDAVIDVENILRRLRENCTLEKPRPAFSVVLDASIEVRGAVVYATVAVILVFVPILTMSGLAGRIFAPLGIAYILAILASLLVALTVTPALCHLLLAQRHLSRAEPPLVGWLKARYRPLLAAVEARPRTAIAVAALLAVAAAAALPFFRAEFLPELREGHFVLHMSALPATSLQESMRLGRQVTIELLKIPAVRSVAQRAGRAEASEDVWGPHYSEFEVDLKVLKGDEAEKIGSDIRKAVEKIPGASFAVKTFLTERIEETLSGYTASLAANIYGTDLGELDRQAQQVAAVLQGISGAAEVQVQSPPGAPQLAVELRQPALLRWGFDPVPVLAAVHTAFGGETVGQVYQGNRVVDVTVVLPPEMRNVAAISALPLRNPDGVFVPLGQLARIYATFGRYIVLHQGARRVQTVTCNVRGRDAGSFMSEARRRIAAQVRFPPGSYVEFSGTAIAQARSRRDLLFHSALAGLGIILLLSIVMASTRNLLLVLANLPFALIGGVIAVLLTGRTLSLGSLVGFVTLFGITLRNSIMMISHYEHLVTVEGMAWGLDAAIRGASERLAPILMTALVTALGLLPMAMGSGDPGREIEGPMAIVILGGLATSTLLNLLVLPTLALRYGRFGPPEEFNRNTPSRDA